MTEGVGRENLSDAGRNGELLKMALVGAIIVDVVGSATHGTALAVELIEEHREILNLVGSGDEGLDGIRVAGIEVAGGRGITVIGRMVE